MNPPFVRSPYNYDVTQASDEAAYVETMPSLTVQSMSEDADINIMMKRFGVGPQMPVNPRLPAYGDFTSISDYRSAIDAANLAAESFMQFPADIRSKFDNDPQLFLEFVENPANINTVKQWFPQESSDGRQNNAGGAVASQGSAAASSGGAGVAPGDGGAGVSK